MALVSAENVAAQANGFGSLPPLRQVGLMIGVALSVALGVAVAIWSQSPNYSLLYGNLTDKDLSQVTASLESAGIEYKIERGGGAIMVSAEKVYEARMKLATEGLPQGGEVGYELLEKEQGFGSSSFLQKARYNRAVEGELAKSISKLNVVESARVHLAIPKQSVFARQSAKPAVSVILNMHPGRVLDDMQVAGIVNMVASSVPGLEAEQVTVIDQKGRLLSSSGSSKSMMQSSNEFDYTRKLEERYTKRIIDIISPMVGLDGVRAQVVADIDFTTQEQTSENYNPQPQAIRSEQLFEESINGAKVGGVPGALTNQPPAGGQTQKQKKEAEINKGNSTKKTVRNYELSRSISHSRQSPVSLKRLSVAVIVDYRSSLNDKGEVERKPLDVKEIEYITSLVKESVGFNTKRGDTINIINTSFQQPEAMEPVPELPLWEQPWVLSLAKQGLGGLAVLFIAFGVLRPMLRNLSSHSELKTMQAPAMLDNPEQNEIETGLQEDQLTLTQESRKSEQQLKDIASGMAKDDPKRVAQVMNNWVSSDG